ncbi:hypothetical protein BCR36DRAFT_372277 [Piromyces finnis]|uniref:TLC domain-containing protein n=1 Tax=Piromyces finnis TaxID=1754191 RepID=A0A1Y1V4R1_9FUNG|nr:hypothetical protein BCR36DRAFT_372277 [Piromyces finnis]|eukprot:ORX46444.1 hypothetical protein BCR36DRAFT_372277 [Piromyces finnis]
MFEYFDLDKDEIIYSSKIFYYVIPIIIIIRIFIFRFFEFVVKCYAKKYSSTYQTLSEKQKNDWCSKSTSIFHAILVTILCIPHTLTDIIFRESNKELAFGVTKRRVDILLWTLAYLIYDSYMMIRVNRQQLSKEMILHHVVCISAFLLGLYINVGTVFMASFIINEISTPFLHLRWFFSRMNKRDSLIANINNLVFAFTYFVFRGVWNTYVFFVLCKGFWEYRGELHKSDVPFCIISCLPIFALSHLLLNYYWLSIIIYRVIQGMSCIDKIITENQTPHENQHENQIHHEDNDKHEQSQNEKGEELVDITVYGTHTQQPEDTKNAPTSTNSIRTSKENTPLLKKL